MKKIIAIFLALIFVFTFAACGKEKKQYWVETNWEDGTGYKFDGVNLPISFEAEDEKIGQKFNVNLFGQKYQFEYSETELYTNKDLTRETYNVFCNGEEIGSARMNRKHTVLSIYGKDTPFYYFDEETRKSLRILNDDYRESLNNNGDVEETKEKLEKYNEAVKKVLCDLCEEVKDKEHADFYEDSWYYFYDGDPGEYYFNDVNFATLPTNLENNYIRFCVWPDGIRSYVKSQPIRKKQIEAYEKAKKEIEKYDEKVLEIINEVYDNITSYKITKEPIFATYNGVACIVYTVILNFVSDPDYSIYDIEPGTIDNSCLYIYIRITE